MSSVGHWLPFIVATMLFACTPGPAILYMTAQTLAHGRRAGMMAALGIHVGCYFHIATAAVGLAAMLHHLPGLYAAIKLAGAAYLVWFGARMLLDRSGPNAGPTSVSAAPAFFRESVVVEMLNPKTALFFLTFLPQFVDPSAALPVGLQFFILGTVVNLALSAADLAAVGLASLASRRMLGSERSGRMMPLVCGSIMIGLAVMVIAQPV